MKRTLVIIRHGKAESFGLVPDDFSRTLVPEGVREARYTGQMLRKAGVMPELLIASAAPRAFYTLRFIADSLGLDPESVLGDRSLYSARKEDILGLIGNFPEETACAAVCGHNPEISDLIPLLAANRGGLSFLNTADAAVIDLPENASWKDAGDGTGTLRLLISKPGRRIS